MTNAYNPARAIVNISMYRNENLLSIGSGFLYRKDDNFYIITAWHNITGRHAETYYFLSPKTACAPNKIKMEISNKISRNGNIIGYERRTYSLNLYNEHNGIYFVHKKILPRVDVVAIPIDIFSPIEKIQYGPDGKEHIFSSPISNKFSNDEYIYDVDPINYFDIDDKILNTHRNSMPDVSDDIYILGYPKGITDPYGQPIWKRASVATPPVFEANGMKMFLVDCASKEGMSGAAAIYYSKTGEINFKNVKLNFGRPITILHGIYTGRVGAIDIFEAQIGTVWQKEVIDEIIEEKIPAEHESIGAATLLEIKESIIKNVVRNKENIEVMEDNIIQRHHIILKIMKDLNGKANPYDVQNIIYEMRKDLLTMQKLEQNR